VFTYANVSILVFNASLPVSGVFVIALYNVLAKFSPCNGNFNITTVLEFFVIFPLIFQALLRIRAFLGIINKFEENCVLLFYGRKLGRNIIPKHW